MEELFTDYIHISNGVRLGWLTVEVAILALINSASLCINRIVMCATNLCTDIQYMIYMRTVEVALFS